MTLNNVVTSPTQLLKHNKPYIPIYSEIPFCEEFSKGSEIFKDTNARDMSFGFNDNFTNVSME